VGPTGRWFSNVSTAEAVRVLRSLLLLLLLALAALAAAALWWQSVLDTPGKQSAVVELRVVSGDSLRSALTRLEAAEVWRQPRLIEAWLRLTYPDFILRTGRYQIAPGASPREVILQLAEGRVVLETLTVIEGTRFADFRRALESHPEVRVTLRGLSDALVMARLGSELHPEGQFFPDTYRFAAGTTDLELLRLAHQRMQRLLAELWSNRAPDLPFGSPLEALILASIVEKESALLSERARVAGVFVSRLRLDMRLQSDPTVIYGIGPSYDGNIRRRDLVTDTPYNTYTRKGLPPTPIALPGESALRAVMQPLVTGELFFVATGDPDGSHRFSKTYAEHRLAVAQYLKALRAARLAAP